MAICNSNGVEEDFFLLFSNVFAYLGATPDSRCVKEGQAALNAKHIITCGIIGKEAQEVNIFALCLQTSALTGKPHEIKGAINIATGNVAKFLCSCKAGMSGRCKHVAAVLFLCTRENIFQLPQLSSTDLKCYWKAAKVPEQYVAAPILGQECIAPKVSPLLKELSGDEIQKILNEGARRLPKSAFGMHSVGRSEIKMKMDCSSMYNLEQTQQMKKVLENCGNFNFLDNLGPPKFLHDCCRDIYSTVANVNIETTARITKYNREIWKLERQFRITGSRCYPIYTYSLDNWENKSLKYFWPKPFTSKYTEHGIKHEGPAREAYRKSNRCEIVETGLIISDKQPWLAYSPDGIIFEGDKPVKLLEIKCPYDGIEVSAIEFMHKCDYLIFDNNRLTLRKKHIYYGQIQLGMGILNLPACDFVVYSSSSKNFLNIVVEFDEFFFNKLAEKLHFNYFQKMIHFVCLNKTKQTYLYVFYLKPLLVKIVEIIKMCITNNIHS